MEFTAWPSSPENVARVATMNRSPESRRRVSETSKSVMVGPGQRSGRLTVLRELPGYPRLIQCRCDCGTVVIRRPDKVASGAVRSCGCLRGGPRLTVKRGQRFGRLKVADAVVTRGPYGERAVLCRCDCGAEKLVGLSRLHGGNSRSCGCWQRKDRSRIVVKRGRRFGRLKVIDPERWKGAFRAALCRCDCGAETLVTVYQLTSGKTRSCGCLFRELAGARRYLPVKVGDRFGRAVVVEPDVGRSGVNKRQVLARCDPQHGGCGTEWVVTLSALRNGVTQSCGCWGADRRREFRATHVGALQEPIDAPDTEMACGVCGEPMSSLSAFDRHYRQEHKR